MISEVQNNTTPARKPTAGAASPVAIAANPQHTINPTPNERVNQ